ncbi:unnamed protein product [Durusdinium trenchii]|uniref:Uncharacterized protein n=1 Tax=Durusdinium trenchii TaxID=1381693 RepID=A0ABP0HW21_9DINO
MIDYGAKKGQPSWFLAFQLTGSVFPHCFLIVFPISVLSLVLKILHDQNVFGEGHEDVVTGFYFLSDGAPWGGFSGFVSFVIVFRLSAAYSTYWSAYTTANAFLGDWSGAAASAVSCCRGSKCSDAKVEVFLHKVIRLFSMLSACALQELSPRKSHQVWGLLTLNSVGIDEKSLAYLDGSNQRVDLCYHWIQQTVVDAQSDDLFGVPPPLVGRILNELSSGMGKFGDAKKHATTQFNFPYAQTCKWLLILYSVLMPLMMVRWSDWASGAFIFTFVQLFFIWTLEAITIILENPFDTSDRNCIDVFQLQLSMNGSLLLLLNPRTRAGPPELSQSALTGDVTGDYEALQRRDTVHKAVLKQEGWQLTDEHELGVSFENEHQRCCCCCSGQQLPKEIARSKSYCRIRYGIIDNQKTAAIAIGVFGDDLIIVVPPTARKLKTSALIIVQSVSGRATKVGVKKISIQDRHKLHKEHNWLPDDYEKFLFEYQDLPAAVYKAGGWIMNLPVASVRRQEELAVEKRINEAKQADKEGLGIDQLSTLVTFEDFIDKLMQEAELTREEANLEWNRRKHLPTEYDQDTDPQGRLIIELNMDTFKEHLAEVKKREQTRIKKLEDARQQIQNALDHGHIEPLAKAIQVAEVETTMSDKELQEAKDRLTSWRLVDGKIQEAIAVRKEGVIRNALREADEVGLKNATWNAASELYRQLVIEGAQAHLKDALEMGDIEHLMVAIEKAEKDMAGISDKGLKEAKDRLVTWKEAQEALCQACESKAPSELKGSVDMSVAIGLRSRKVALAKQLLAEHCATELEELDTAMKAGDVEKLAAVLADLAEKNVLAAEDMKRGNERLKAMQNAQKALQEGLSSNSLDALRSATEMAEEAKLQGATREEAERKLQELEAASELEAAFQEADRMEAQKTVLPGEANARPM